VVDLRERNAYDDGGVVRATLGRGNPESTGLVPAGLGTGFLDHAVGEPATYVQAPRC
jgi:hypothetical protein